MRYDFLLKKKHIAVNNVLNFLNNCQFTPLKEEISINNNTNESKRNSIFLTRPPHFQPTFEISKYTKEQQKFLTMFNFQPSNKSTRIFNTNRFIIKVTPGICNIKV